MASSIISNTYSIPEGCLEICNGVIKKTDLGLSKDLATQVEVLEKRIKHKQALRLQRFQVLLDSKIQRLQETFIERLENTVAEVVDKNDAAFSQIESICSDVCKEVLAQIGAGMTSQEKVNIMIKDALKQIGTTEECTIRLPTGSSISSLLPVGSEKWEIKEDDSLPEDEVVINVDFGKIAGSFNTSFKEMIDEII